MDFSGSENKTISEVEKCRTSHRKYKIDLNFFMSVLNPKLVDQCSNYKVSHEFFKISLRIIYDQLSYLNFNWHSLRVLYN